jgi:hypothetical protein
MAKAKTTRAATRKTPATRKPRKTPATGAAKGRGLVEVESAAAKRLPVLDMPEATDVVRAAHYVEAMADAVVKTWKAATNPDDGDGKADVKVRRERTAMLEKLESIGFEASYTAGGAGWRKEEDGGSVVHSARKPTAQLLRVTDSGKLRFVVAVPARVAGVAASAVSRRYDVAAQVLALVIRGAGIACGDGPAESGAAKVLFEALGAPKGKEPKAGTVIQALESDRPTATLRDMQRHAIAAAGEFDFPGASTGEEKVRTTRQQLVGIGTLWLPDGSQTAFPGAKGQAAKEQRIPLPASCKLPVLVDEEGEPKLGEDGEPIRGTSIEVEVGGEPAELRLRQRLVSRTSSYTPGSKRK